MSAKAAHPAIRARPRLAAKRSRLSLIWSHPARDAYNSVEQSARRSRFPIYPSPQGRSNLMSSASPNVDDRVEPKEGTQSFAETAMRLSGKSEEEARRLGAV